VEQPLQHELERHGASAPVAAPQTVAPVVRRPPAEHALAGAPELREAARVGWHIVVDPPSSVVPVRSEVTFTLGPQGGPDAVRWRPLPGSTEHRPLFTLTLPSGEERSWHPRLPVDKVTVPLTFDEPGHYRARFRAHPVTGAGPPDAPFALSYDGEISVSVDFDVVGDLSAATLETEEVKRTARRDLDHLEDPDASALEISEAFKRIVVRRAIEVVNANHKEAEGLVELYTKGSATETPGELAGEIAKILVLDAKLAAARPLNGGQIEQAIVAGKVRGRVHEYIADHEARIDSARAALFDAFPAATLARGEFRQPFIEDPSVRTAVLAVTLRNVIADCDATRTAIATGDLDVWDAEIIVAETRKALGIADGDRQAIAIDDAIARHQHAKRVETLGLAGVTLLLLLVPGIGPFLAAVAGLTGAAIAWERASDLITASHAGVSGGIVSQKEAATAAFWAALDTVLAVIDLSAAIKPLTKIAPHVPEAAERVLPRAAQASANVAGQTAPFAASAGRGAAGTFAMTADELAELATRLFRRPVRPMTGQVHFYATWEEYVAAFRKDFPLKEFPDLKPPNGGYFESAGGNLRIAPGQGVMTAVHEAVHKIAEETFPYGRALLGDFFNEGLTEAITRARLGPEVGRVYEANVRFVAELQQRLGRDVVENAVLHGNYRQLRDAVKRALGGSEAATFEFFGRLRGVPVDPGAEGTKTLEELLAMLEGGKPRGSIGAGAGSLPLAPSASTFSSTTKASLKRIAQEAGEAFSGAVEQGLASAEHSLKDLRGRLGTLAGDARLGGDAQGVMRNAGAAIDGHLTNEDLVAAVRDNVGIPVRERGSGEAFDHLREVRDAVNSLDRARDQLLRTMRGQPAGALDYSALSGDADAVKETMRLINALLELRP
jgi:hypothetical protein